VLSGQVIAAWWLPPRAIVSPNTLDVGPGSLREQKSLIWHLDTLIQGCQSHPDPGASTALHPSEQCVDLPRAVSGMEPVCHGW
jgi:hypothetical protein